MTGAAVNALLSPSSPAASSRELRDECKRRIPIGSITLVFSQVLGRNVGSGPSRPLGWVRKRRHLILHLAAPPCCSFENVEGVRKEGKGNSLPGVGIVESVSDLDLFALHYMN